MRKNQKMRKFVLAALLLPTVLSNTNAQTNEDKRPRPRQTPTESSFNMMDYYVNIRDYVYLQNKSKVIFELNHVDQYAELRDSLSAIINSLFRDIAFYADSLKNGSSSVRIDYAVDKAYGFSKIRIKRHHADGDIFMAQTEDVSKLKLDQDTVRIYFRHDPVLERPNNSRRDWARNFSYNFSHAQMYQVTFCVNNYEDLRKFASNRALTNKIFDTLISTKRKRTVTNPHDFPSTSIYFPYGQDTPRTERCNSCLELGRFKQYSSMAYLEYPTSNIIRRSDMLMLTGNVGAGVIRNVLAPYGEAGIQFSKIDRRLINFEHQQRYSLYAFVSCHYIFERGNDSKFYSKDNWFANFAIGEGNGNMMGVGYRFAGKGNYFSGTTMKLFFDYKVTKKGVTISPELFFTNDFKQIFPGLTIKAL